MEGENTGGICLPERLAVPETDDGDRDAGDEAVAGEAKGEVCGSGLLVNARRSVLGNAAAFSCTYR